MATEDFKRKLTAIFSADVAGYSRLMGEDEAATVKTLTSSREIMASLIKQHRGRIVDSPGDNVLAEFVSVVDAVQCGVAVQKELQTRNAELPDNRKMEFRIGINLGDVIDEEDRIYGDGVNIAARLEALADPGGICISKTAFDQIETKLPLGYEFLGEQDVKNIAKPVGAYRVLMDAEAAGKVIGELKPRAKQLRWAAVGALAVLIIGAGAFAIWNFYLRPPFEPASKERMAFPLPDKPSIAVLAFDNLSGEPNQDYFGDGIAEDIITQLSQIHNLFVIARNSSFTYKGKPVKVQKVAEELGVRYVLEGSVQKSGDRVRITVQLVDATTGKHLWAHRYDRELKDVFAVQDEITQKVVTELAVKLTEGENERLMQRGTQNREAWTLYRKAVAQFRRFNKAANLKARELSEQAIALDSNYSQAYSLLSWTYAWPVRFGLSSSPAEDLKKAEELVNKASGLDSSNHDARNVLGFIYMVRGQYDQAIIQGKRAVELAPSVTDSYALLALSQNFAGHYDEATESMLKGMRLAPFYPPWFLNVLAESYFMAGRFEDALETHNLYLDKNPDALRPRVWIAAAYIALGKPEKARAEAEKILKKKPTFSLKAFSKVYPFKNKTDFDRVLSYARKAGLPKTPPLPLPDKPSIAVLPFVNMSGDPGQEYFSDGITEEIITALSKVPDLFVIARNSSFTYKGKSVWIPTVGRELGVRYVLEGSFRKAGDKIRVTGQLVDAKTGHHLWAERYDRELEDVFAIQDEITMKILTALQVELTIGEEARLHAKGTDNLEAHIKVLQGRDQFYRFNKKSNARAKQLFKEAIALDPEYAMAYRFLSSVHLLDVWIQATKSPRESLSKAFEMAKKAISLDDSLADAYALLGSLYTYKRQHDKAIAKGEHAVALDPNSADAHIYLAQSLFFAGRHEESIAYSNKAIRLNPIPPVKYYLFLGHALCHAGRYEEAIEAINKVLRRKPNNLFAHTRLISCYSLLGRDEEARAEAAEVLRINPKFSLRRLAKTLPFKNKADSELIINALSEAGLK